MRLENPRRLLWPVLIMATLFTVSGTTNLPAAGVDWISMDKVAHFAVFGALATSWLRCVYTDVHRWKSSVVVWVLAAGFGALDEWRQSFTPGRAVEFADWAADASGALVAILLYSGWSHYRKMLETPLFFRSR